VWIGGTSSLDEAAAFLLDVGPAARALRAAGGEKTEAVRAAIRDAIAPYATGAGVSMGGALWVVTARKP
jgi:hypothetical protein